MAYTCENETKPCMFVVYTLLRTEYPRTMIQGHCKRSFSMEYNKDNSFYTCLGVFFVVNEP